MFFLNLSLFKFFRQIKPSRNVMMQWFIIYRPLSICWKNTLYNALLVINSFRWAGLGIFGVSAAVKSCIKCCQCGNKIRRKCMHDRLFILQQIKILCVRINYSWPSTYGKRGVFFSFDYSSLNQCHQRKVARCTIKRLCYFNAGYFNWSFFFIKEERNCK